MFFNDSLGSLHGSMAIIGCMALALNGLCILGMLKSPGKLSVRNRLVLNLCAADAAFVINELIHIFVNDDRYLCLFAFYARFEMAANFITLGSMAALALALFFAIVKPLKYANFIAGRGPWISIIAIWTLSAVLGFVDFAVYAILPVHRGNFTLTYCNAVSIQPFTFTLVMYLLALCTVVVLYVFLYTKSFAILYQRRNQRLSRHSTNERSLRKGFLTTSLILVTFLFLYLPYAILLLYMLFYYDFPLKIIQSAVKFGQILNCISDPIIFAARNIAVINGLRTIFHCGRAAINGSSADREDKASCIMCMTSKCVTSRNESERTCIPMRDM